ncbi:MAG: 6,7-dimethyl-8-ribityllumazine synthase [Bacteroidetes bacterium]|nr:6,7-dimethyl-8-ribityllumazine synthase [Bacteroidota bacterium]
MKIVEGTLHGEHKKFAVVMSKVNSSVTENLLDGALSCLKENGVDKSAILVIRVPGAWEIPIAAERVAKSNAFDAVICLGAIIRGETPHFEYVAGEVSKGIAAISRKTGKPVAFGVLITDTIEQAAALTGEKGDNKGWEAAGCALEMVNLMEKIGQFEGSSFLQGMF